MKICTSSNTFYFLLLILVSSCIPQKQIEYLQDPVLEKNLYELPGTEEIRIRPNDELYIKVSSFDDVSYNFFSSQGEYSRTGFSNELSVSLITYTVNDSGYIYFPILGSILVEKLTLDELRTFMEKELTQYFNQPTIVVKFAYKKVTVLGEVNQPGSYTYSRNRINILEALGLAGDLTVHGNRKEITLIRQAEGTVEKCNIDLTRDTHIFSDYYYLQPNDIIYVKPRSSIKWSVIATPISLILTSISTTILIMNLILRETP